MNDFEILNPIDVQHDHLIENEYPTEIFTLSHPIKKTFDSGNHNYLIYVLTGNAVININANRTYSLQENMYCNCDEKFDLENNGLTLIIKQHHYKGLFSIGGPVKEKGILQYIDGCSDTLLLSPDIMGNPCFNLLYIPPYTNQSQHTHPSYRIGVILSGTGLCKTANEEIELYPGLIFIIPKDSLHSFFTQDTALRVVAYHPDSDFGPTHENHPMINKTILQ